MTIYAIQFAGIILLCITSANFFAPKKMRWSVNLAKTEPVFRQVFIVHCVFLLGCVLAMALACLILPHQLLTEPLGRVLLAFMALFWTARVLVQFFYYERSIKREFPVFNVLFSVAFIYLAVCFSFLSLT
ncbi:hypothetical protein JIN77_07000 [Verrucomicrobiaceae bacterium R5-34]|uniref:Uncharacterized protein n=1 Tax=Oceaniferula flava TaxID=2800421 RepID=A0AAE2SDI7_9BACT|nr:hypothetical protein [Oceaniferula flavus]MBK1830467.1 hypothetical protein [Verrucomicrobiaceae bacterium R5-34]MBK1854560.1 hypothetical protein [Oceaniferula flavus]MBM1135866.1 hypothetical protein [Oceaniferula flavus]